ncbi:MAG: hypothetical protein WEA04_01910 [Candidatus Andersenbacteria bacterium]
MKNTFRALFGVSALALLLVAAPVLAAEVDVTAENVMTGADSDNNNDTDVDNDLDVNVDNVGNVSNSASAAVTTGNNEQNENTEGGDVDSGAVDASTDWESIVNAGAALLDNGDGLEVSADFSNDTTGADSDNDNDLDVDHDVDLDLRNIANILNYLALSANTGDNEQNKNTMGGELTTGDVTVDSMIANLANNGAGYASLGTTQVDVSGSNHLTGADSNNNNDVDVDNDYDLDVDNTANLTTSVVINAHTGGNEQNRNTQGGSMTTGNVEVSTKVENSANNNSSIGIGGSSLAVTVEASNDTTGADSDNDNDVDVDNNVDIDVDNTANVSNNLTVSANTGDNEQNKNTQGGGVETGSVSINFEAFNEVNSN